MTQENSRPAQGGAAGRSGGPRTDSSGHPWPTNLATPDLEKLVRSLAAGVKAASELPHSAETERLIHAHAVAQIALRRRRARQRVEDAQRALNESGWSA